METAEYTFFCYLIISGLKMDIYGTSLSLVSIVISVKPESGTVRTVDCFSGDTLPENILPELL